MGIVASLVLGLGWTAVAVAQEDLAEMDMATLNQRAAKLDPEHYKFVQPVCTRCHTPALFLHSRQWGAWGNIFHQMTGYGAEATPEQWDNIYKYFATALTQINVNHADIDELVTVLGVDEKTAIAIVQRRSDKKFETAEDVEAVPGVSKARVEAFGPRLLFDQPPEVE